MHDLNALPLTRLFEELTADGSLDRLIRASYDEDLQTIGDITSGSIIASGQVVRASLIARKPGVLAGIQTMVPILKMFGAKECTIKAMSDGEAFAAQQTLGTVSCERRILLGAERLMLNLLGHLSGIATLTRRYVDAVAGTRAVICDTRKTTPGLRNLEKYAVRCGGGYVHRIGLFDAALYKDNHLAGIEVSQLSQALMMAIRNVRREHQLRFVEVEVDTLDQLRELLRIEPGLIDIVLLDNMTLEQLRTAVQLRNDQSTTHIPPSQIALPLLECSGGVTLERVRAIAETGVDRIAVGAITHSAGWLDIGLDIA